jgi:hypothetical protein
MNHQTPGNPSPHGEILSMHRHRAYLLSVSVESDRAARVSVCVSKCNPWTQNWMSRVLLCVRPTKPKRCVSLGGWVDGILFRSVVLFCFILYGTRPHVHPRQCSCCSNDWMEWTFLIGFGVVEIVSTFHKSQSLQCNAGVYRSSCPRGETHTTLCSTCCRCCCLASIA